LLNLGLIIKPFATILACIPIIFGTLNRDLPNGAAGALSKAVFGDGIEKK
jgi:hypothetical protein